MARKAVKYRNDGLIEKKVWVIDENGNRKRKSIYHRDPVELDIKVTEIKDQVNKGIYIIDNNSTFEQLARKWYKIHATAKEETTREGYEINMNHAIKLFGPMKIQEIKTSDVKEKYNNFLFEIDENGNKNILHSKNSLKRLHTVVNMIFKLAIQDKLLWKNPCDALNKKEMKPDVFEPYVYTEDEFNSLLERVKGTKVEIVALLAGGIGMRASEICALKKDKINIGKSQITINDARYRIKGKTGDKGKTKSRNRTIFVDSYILETIMAHENNSEYVICRSTGKPYRNDELYHMFDKSLKDKEGNYILPKTRLHDLRHYNATQMALRGVDIRTAAYRLGDTPETVLKIYQHVQENMDRSAAEKLGNMFKKKNDNHVVNSVVNDKKERISDTTIEPGNPLLN